MDIAQRSFPLSRYTSFLSHTFRLLDKPCTQAIRLPEVPSLKFTLSFYEAETMQESSEVKAVVPLPC
ncbi:hypothetical protein V1477_006566 [Vespula maculifrons]|uniref:Uncharacterized protein n=1 Tax=Vespula maculifrons TaxID=7453 RepID=A0ABD2CJ75_VESMC